MWSDPDVRNFDSLTRASALLAFSEIHDYRTRYPNISPRDAATALRRGAASVANFDYEIGLELVRMVTGEIPSDGRERFRFVLRTLIDIFRPHWRTKAQLGRDAIRAELSRDQFQCFSMSGLFDSAPVPAAVKWWTELASAIRIEVSALRAERGREGEQLSFEYERNRLQAKGLDTEVRWTALDDETAGYDIKSVDDGGQALAPKLIEAKACRGYPLTFFVTRNEWETSIAVTCKFVYHLWHVPSRTLHEFDPSRIAGLMPLDQSPDGRWDVARLTVNP
jgi:hypothetical protein